MLTSAIRHDDYRRRVLSPAMKRKATAHLLKWLKEAGPLPTRIKERGLLETSDIAICQAKSSALALDMGLTEDVLLALLDELRRDGVLICVEAVHPFDPSEYICHWTIAQNRSR